jgi:hypothetical protein
MHDALLPLTKVVPVPAAGHGVAVHYGRVMVGIEGAGEFEGVDALG